MLIVGLQTTDEELHNAWFEGVTFKYLRLGVDIRVKPKEGREPFGRLSYPGMVVPEEGKK